MPSRREGTSVRRGTLTPIGEILRGAFERLEYLPALKRHRIWTEWEAIVGPDISKVARLERLRGSTLYVRVRDSSWMQHLVWLRDGLVRLIQQRLGPDSITKLHLSLEENDRASTGDQEEDRPAR